VTKPNPRKSGSKKNQRPFLFGKETILGMGRSTSIEQRQSKKKKKKRGRTKAGETATTKVRIREKTSGVKLIDERPMGTRD